MSEELTPAVKPIVTETVISKDEHEKALNAVAERERAKLYADLQKKEERAKAAAEKAEALEARLKELEELEKQREYAKLELTERLQKQLEDTQKKADEALRIAALKEQEAENIRKTVKLEKLKESLIRKEGIEPEFADFIQGNSDDEIVASVEKAKKLQDKLKGSVVKEVPQTPGPTAPATPHPATLVDQPDINQVGSYKDLMEYKRRVGLLR